MTVNGQPLVVPDVEALFNSAQIDYDYDNFSLHEFMSLMIVLRGTDAEKKVEYVFKLYDADRSGHLGTDEVTKMLSALLAAKADSKAEPDKMIKEFTKKMDKNSDGKVSLAELTTALKNADFLDKYIGKGASVDSVADAALGKTSSKACLVM